MVVSDDDNNVGVKNDDASLKSRELKELEKDVPTKTNKKIVPLGRPKTTTAVSQESSIESDFSLSSRGDQNIELCSIACVRVYI